MTKFVWTAIGTEIGGSPGAMLRDFHETGEREADMAGEVLEWLTEHGTIWDCIDQLDTITIEIKPASALPDPEPTWESIQRSARESMYERPAGATVATWSDPRCQVTTMSATFAERCKLVDGHAGGHLFGAES